MTPLNNLQFKISVPILTNSGAAYCSEVGVRFGFICSGDVVDPDDLPGLLFGKHAVTKDGPKDAKKSCKTCLREIGKVLYVLEYSISLLFGIWNKG